MFRLSFLLVASSFSVFSPHCLFSAQDVAFSSPRGRISFSAQTGAITSVTPSGSSRSLWKSGEDGLWRIHFSDKTTLSASDFYAPSSERRVQRLENNTWKFESPEATVVVWAESTENGISLQSRVTAKSASILDVEFPAKLRFSADRLKRFVFPQSGSDGLGVAFHASFFKEQPVDSPAGWEIDHVGPAGYAHLFGKGLQSLDLATPPVTLQITPEGRKHFSPDWVKRIEAQKCAVNRAPWPAQADLVWINSTNGPLVSASRLGGSGALWRFATGAAREEAPLVREIVGQLVRAVAKQAGDRKKIGFVHLMHGPKNGFFTGINVLQSEMATRDAASRASRSFVLIQSLSALQSALRDPAFHLIVNPYGEAFPAASKADLFPMLDQLKGFVRQGGQWIEVGGYPFFHALKPIRFTHFSASYPPLFCDFFHQQSTDDGNCAVYGVQPRLPYAQRSSHRLFTPGRLGCGADVNGGFCYRMFSTYIRKGTTWDSPAVHFSFLPVHEALACYAKANDLTRPLQDKMPSAALEKLKRSLLLYLAGSCREKDAALSLLPVPSLIHFSDYLKGGFDKEYPDHLPPRPAFGTSAELVSFLAKARAAGHLVSPYTNPTWWCDHPRGPTFLAAGEAPLLKREDGSARYERYGRNDGWTTTLWHPAVRAANQRVVTQFTKEFPVDILFQDQCGARGWVYDFNPASPTPTAYAEGMIVMNERDSRVVPLGTENGWDKVANEQTLLCGLSWATVPTEHGPEWISYFKHRFAPELWTLYPIAAYLFHDKAIFYHHDLGQFVTNDRVLAWTLALGYSLSYRMRADHYVKDKRLQNWVAWLGRLQDHVVSRMAGQPLKSFRHDRTALFESGRDPTRMEDDGMIVAQYGEVSLEVNLGDSPRRTKTGLLLASYGYSIKAPGLWAAALEGKAPFIQEGSQMWTYTPVR